MNYCLKYELLSSVWTFVFNVNFCLQYELLSSLWTFVFTVNFCLQCELLSSVWTLIFSVNFCLQCELLSSVWTFVFSVNFCLQFELLSSVWTFVFSLNFCLQSELSIKGDSALDLSYRQYLSMDWKNNEKCDPYVLVQSKDLVRCTLCQILIFSMTLYYNIRDYWQELNNHYSLASRMYTKIKPSQVKVVLR